MNAIQRRYEYQADAFATKNGYGPQLKTALVKLEVENASSLSNHWLVSLVRDKCGWMRLLICSHPSLADRCPRVSEEEKKLD